jgi:hypothetical protein
MHASLSVCWHQYGSLTPDRGLYDHVNGLTSGHKAFVSCIQHHMLASLENSSSNACMKDQKYQLTAVMRTAHITIILHT